MTFIDELNNSYKYVCDNSKSVKINYENIDKMIEKIDNSKVSYWLKTNPYDIDKMDAKSLINFLLIYHTIGDYCFWGNPKWKVKTDIGTIDGSYAIMYIILKRFKTNNNFNITFDEFKDLLKGNVVIPLLEDRYDNLVKMNYFLKKKKSDFYELTKNINNDIDLLNYILKKLDYFKDTSYYDDKEIYFYKRAQLLISDVLHVKEMKEGKKVDYSNIIGCADYKIPQVLRCYEMLEYDDKLKDKIDKKIELSEGSKEEVEIRANTLKIIDYIYEKLNKKYKRMDINDFIWLLGQDKSKMTKPYHRTLTKHY